MKNNGSLIWMLLGLTQIFLMFGMWEELEGPMTTLFGSSGAAMLVLAGYFWIQDKRNNALSELQGYSKEERTNTIRNDEGTLVEQVIGRKDRSGLWITFSWFIICWLVTRLLF